MSIRRSFIGVLAGLLLCTEGLAVDWAKVGLTVNNIDMTRGGSVVVLVFQGQGFPKQHDKALKAYRFPASEVKDASKSLDIAVPDGEFAIKVHHDEDDSGSITKNWTGVIPAEGLGFSAGARLFFGPPSFKSAKMQRPEDGRISIAIRYP